MYRARSLVQAASPHHRHLRCFPNPLQLLSRESRRIPGGGGESPAACSLQPSKTCSPPPVSWAGGRPATIDAKAAALSTALSSHSTSKIERSWKKPSENPWSLVRGGRDARLGCLFAPTKTKWWVCHFNVPRRATERLPCSLTYLYFPGHHEPSRYPQPRLRNLHRRPPPLSPSHPPSKPCAHACRSQCD